MDVIHHTDHLHQQHESAPPPAPASTHKPSAEVLLEEESATKPPSFLLPLSLPNGTTLKKHRQEPPPPPLAWSRPHGRHDRRNNKDHVVYRECMKNHAAALGGHALDGCGEFMPSPASTTSAPASLACAACGCHRNFHRRLLQYYYNDEREEGHELEERDDDDDDVVEGLCRPSPPPPRKGAGFYQYSSSAAPHMLMALSAGCRGTVPVIRPSGSTTPPAAAGTTAPSAGAPSTGVVAIRTVVLPAGKRFRTKFTPEQKAGMQELCEQLGWRMQRRDDALLEQRCREIGVSRGVFKVWMHNNKHAFVGGPSSRRGGGGGAVAGAGGATTGADGGGGGGSCVVSVNGDSGNGGSTGHAAVDGSPVSS